jgi:hypothetical protein
MGNDRRAQTANGSATGFYFAWEVCNVSLISLLFALGFFGGNFTIFTLWLPEQFETRVRATAFAFCTSVGRFVGAGVNFLLGEAVLRMGTLGIPIACISLVFLLGLLLIPLAPETKGQTLPD